MNEARIGAPAPDGVFLAADGAKRRLSEFWAERPAVLLFLRHFG